MTLLPLTGSRFRPLVLGPGGLFSSDLFWWVICALCAAVLAWSGRYEMNSDGLSYLDMASNAVHNGPRHLVNGYWSPLYPAAIALAMFVLRPSPELEAPVLHLVNFLIFLLVLACFAFFLRRWREYSWTLGGTADESAEYFTPLAYCIFLWLIVDFQTLSTVTPDLAVAGFVFLAAGMSCRIKCPGTRLVHYSTLGAILGAAYYAKTSMLPIGLILLGLLYVWPPSASIIRKRILLAGTMLIVAAAPLVLLVSAHVGHIAISESGRLNYIWHITGLPTWAGWVGDSGTGIPEHPPRTLSRHPLTLEFAFPVDGTYPLWYDPSYWYAGAKARFDLARQIAALIIAFKKYWASLSDMSGLAFGASLLWFVPHRGRKRLELRLDWAVAWPLAVFALYASVRVEDRYVGGFWILLWLGLYRFLLPPARVAIRNIVLAILFVSLCIPVGIKVAGAIHQVLVDAKQPRPPEDLVIAKALRDVGVVPGDRIAIIGYTFDCYYVRYAGAHVVAQVFDDDQFWKLSESGRAQITHLFALLGVKTVVARHPPLGNLREGWQDVIAEGPRRIRILPLNSPPGTSLPISR